MTVCISTSSPNVSVALIERGAVVASASQPGLRNASWVALDLYRQLLAKAGASEADIGLYVADTGPGSFIGVRIATTLAKTLAFAQGKPCAAVSSFDLIAPDRIVAFPSKRGEWFVRVPGEAPFRTASLPEEATGYGPGMAAETYPDAAKAAKLTLTPLEPVALMPFYGIEPSISVPKTPYRAAEA